VEKSAIPAKGDRGRSESDIVRSYSECRRTTPWSLRVESCFWPSCGAPWDATARVGRRCPAEAVPRRGGNAGRWKWRLFSFSRDCWKSFPGQRAGNGRKPGEQPFSNVQPYFHEGEHCEYFRRCLRRQLTNALRPASLPLPRRYRRALLPGLVQPHFGQSRPSAQSRGTPEIRWHSASSSSWVPTSLAILFGARGR
jgi:hypothetical protein